MSDDRFSEEWDPSQFEPEPDLRGGYLRAPQSILSDRQNATIFHATEEFEKNMSEYEVSVGRELSAAAKFRARRHFEATLSRDYGASRPDGAWLSRHEGWHGRNQGAQS